MTSEKCANGEGQLMSDAIRSGDIHVVMKIVDKDPSILHRPILSSYKTLTALHIAAYYGRAHVMGVLLELGVEADARDTKSSTPLMVACKRGKVACVERLLQSGANALVFEACHGRTRLHYAARGGQLECVERIIRAAQTGPIAHSWGFVRFVNVRDTTGATPLHMAARGGNAVTCRLLLESGALVSATTSTFGYGPQHGSTPLHSAARGGSMEVIQELLAWEADRTQRDLMGLTPYLVALKHNNIACANILNPDVAEPIVWPSACEFINSLEPKAKSILQAALVAANQEREEHFSVTGTHEDTTISDSQPVSGKLNSEHLEHPVEIGGMDVMEICCICFEKSCTFEIKNCGHHMCASCTLALCCHNKPNPYIAYCSPLSCPFCQGNISQLVLLQSQKIEMKRKDMDLAQSGSKNSKRRSWSRDSVCSGGGSKGSGQMSAKGSGRIIDIVWINHV